MAKKAGVRQLLGGDFLGQFLLSLPVSPLLVVCRAEASGDGDGVTEGADSALGDHVFGGTGGVQLVKSAFDAGDAFVEITQGPINGGGHLNSQIFDECFE